MELMKKLTDAVAPSGREKAAADIIKRELASFCDEIYKDTLGNLVCRKKRNGKKLMLAAHMDEIGFMVTYIDENGFLRFTAVGGVQKHNCINAAVMFTNGTLGKISYENKENPSTVSFEKMYIDIGASSFEEACEKVNIGDMATYAPSFFETGNCIISKALDDRAGCWALIRAVQSAKESPNDLYAVFTAQEEVGLRGAKTSAAHIKPDLAVAVDVSNVGDTPGSEELNLKTGKGPALKIKDASFLIHESVKKLLKDSAESAKIPYQIEAASTGGTDAGAIHLSGGGIAAGAVSLPARYIHSNGEAVNKDDLENTSKWLKTLIETDIKEYISF